MLKKLQKLEMQKHQKVGFSHFIHPHHIYVLACLSDAQMIHYKLGLFNFN